MSKAEVELENQERASGAVHYDPATGLLSDRGYQIVASHITKHMRECPTCRSRKGFSVAEHLNVVPGFKLQSSHTVVLVMCNTCYDIRSIGAVKLGVDR